MKHHLSHSTRSTSTLSTPSDARGCIALLSTNPNMAMALAPAFHEHFPNVQLRSLSELGRFEDIEAAVCWQPPSGLLRRFSNLQLIQSSGAGVDHILADAELPDSVPVCRIADADMAKGMAAYVCWAVINHYRRLNEIVEVSKAGIWQEKPIEATSHHCVGILGAGSLGTVCADVLSRLGFPVVGWRRSSGHDVAGFSQIFHGVDQLEAFLSCCNALVCLLPLTAETYGVLSSDLFSHLPDGAHLINVGRGEHLVETDLIEALERGKIAFATVDTFRQEPLPQSHTFWREPRILVTPHIATRPSPSCIAIQTLTNLFLIREGKPPLNQIDRVKGY